MRVSCSLALPAGVADHTFNEPATLRLTIQDVTMLDESSTVVAALAVPVTSRVEVLEPFEVEADLQSGRRYALYAHLDVLGDGIVAPGDLINTARVPIVGDPAHHVTQVEVPLQMVV